MQLFQVNGIFGSIALFAELFEQAYRWWLVNGLFNYTNSLKKNVFMTLLRDCFISNTQICIFTNET